MHKHIFITGYCYYRLCEFFIHIR